MPLSQLVYISQAIVPLGDTQLRALLWQSRAANHACRITGLLLYADGRFMQVLEGEREAVQTLYYGHIVHDPRHHELQLLCEGPAARRSFPDWSMGFVPAVPAQAALLTGYFHPAQPHALPFRASAADPALLTLLQEFATAP